MNRKTVLSIAGVGVAALIAAVIVTLNLLGGAPPLNVNDLRGDPSAFKGKVKVIGVMAGVSRVDATVIGLMDRAELACKSPNCEKFYLPVRFAGPQPVVGDEVEVVGAIKADEQVLVASALKVLRNHKL